VTTFRKPLLILRFDLKHTRYIPSLKEDKMGEGGAVALMEAVRNVEKILVGKTEEKKPLERKTDGRILLKFFLKNKILLSSSFICAKQISLGILQLYIYAHTMQSSIQLHRFLVEYQIFRWWYYGM
jgi:hypothetical protein